MDVRFCDHGSGEGAWALSQERISVGEKLRDVLDLAKASLGQDSLRYKNEEDGGEYREEGEPWC